MYAGNVSVNMDEISNSIFFLACGISKPRKTRLSY